MIAQRKLELLWAASLSLAAMALDMTMTILAVVNIIRINMDFP